MPDEPQDAPAARMPDGRPRRAGPADIPRDTATGAVEPVDGPGTEAEGSPDAATTAEPVAVSGDDPGVGLTRSTRDEGGSIDL